MSQTQTVSTQSDEPVSKTSASTTSSIHLTQVAPQESVKTTTSKSKAKSSKHIDPQYVKSPLPGTPSNGSRPTSRTGSLKGQFGAKGGFLSLLLCCTFGAGSLLDNSDKSAAAVFPRHRKKSSNRHSRASTTTTTSSTDENRPGSGGEKGLVPAVPKTPSLPKIFTSPTELARFDGDQDSVGPDTSFTSCTPRSMPPQSPEGQIMWLLPPLAAEHSGRKCLVLDLDETLVHSSFKIIPNPDFIVPVEIDNQYHNVYVLKRPGVDEFMRRMGEMYEIVVFTASLSKYADPVLDMLDVHKVVNHRLFRESCLNHKGTYVKDLSQLGRDLSKTLILDNSPASYIFHTANAVPVSTWFSDPHDTELTDLVAFLEDLTMVDDVTLVLDSAVDTSMNAG